MKTRPRHHLMSSRGYPANRGYYGRREPYSPERGDNPFHGLDHTADNDVDNIKDQAIRLRLQSQIYLNRALEMENSLVREELNHLRGRFRAQTPPAEDWIAIGVRPTGHGRPLADRIDSGDHQPPPHHLDRDRAVTFGRQQPRPPTVTVQPTGIHPRFLPLGTHFQEGGTGAPRFSELADWPDAILASSSIRPCGVRMYGSQIVNLDDLKAYLEIGQLIYGGNRPPGRRDPIEPRRPWKNIEAAFFRGLVVLILQPFTLAVLESQLTPSQRVPYRQPFLHPVENPNQLDPKDIVEHLVRMEVPEHWHRSDTVVGYARSYLRSWARRQLSETTRATDLGRLFRAIHPNGIPHQNDKQFIEDAEAEVETQLDGMIEEPREEDGGQGDDRSDLEDDEMPPLEPQSPSPTQVQEPPRGRVQGRQMPESDDEELDWGEDDLPSYQAATRPEGTSQ